MTLRAWPWIALWWAAAAVAQPAPPFLPPPPPSPSTTASTGLPAPLQQALARAELPPEALHVMVQEVGGGPVWLAHREHEPVNPASLTKLLTTAAALDLLGPAWRWQTPVWLDGSLNGGVLEGHLVIKGSGDPTLVIERVWLLLQRVRELGVREIRGDIVLDRSAFAPAEGTPADFDGEPWRPQNVLTDALLLNQRSLMVRFVPEAGAGVARVSAFPMLAGLQVDARVPLSPGPCTADWRAGLGASIFDPQALRFSGTYPAACGERVWPLAYAEPASYDRRLLEAMWRAAGGTLGGQTREGAAPLTPPTFEWPSPPLAEVVRDINKFSSNVMAQQLFLTLGLQFEGRAAPAAARAVLGRWLGEMPPGTWIDNGSGLSRHTRLSAALLMRVLQSAWAGPAMPELLASLPVAGLDGTLRRSLAATGRAHLKTGSLRDVAAVGGIVLARDGRRLALVAVVHQPQAPRARELLDAVVQWAADGARR